MEDLEYITKREALIPFAEQYADGITGHKPKQKEGENKYKYYIRIALWGDRWNRAFHGRMNELARGIK